jgi:hypothetical protein
VAYTILMQRHRRAQALRIPVAGSRPGTPLQLDGDNNSGIDRVGPADSTQGCSTYWRAIYQLAPCPKVWHPGMAVPRHGRPEGRFSSPDPVGQEPDQAPRSCDIRCFLSCRYQ